MKNLKYIVFLTILLFSYSQGLSQIWPKVYQLPGTGGAFPRWFIRSYDRGYYINSTKSNNKFSWLIKTDINGDILWDKKIGDGIKSLIITSCDQAQDGCVIIVGSTSKLDNSGDPYIMKLSHCGEPLWCKIISTPGDADYAWQTRATTDNCFLMLCRYSDPNPKNRIQLFKFTNEGVLLWKQNYPPDSLMFAEDSKNLYVDSNYYLLSARCYYPEPGQTNGGYERPYYIKTDTSGNIIWRLIYGYENGFHGFPSCEPIISTTNNFYDIGWHSNYCDTPAMVKFTASGTESYFTDLFPQACPGGHSAIKFLNDTTLVAFVGGTVNGSNQQKWIKTDTLGIEYQAAFFTQGWMTKSGFIEVDQDKKIACVSHSGTSIYFYKLNSNLEFDTLYTTPFVYDSLCPYPIVSDTIDLDCGVIVHVPEPEKQPEAFEMKVFPNPATGKLIVRIPGYVQNQTGPADFRATTVYYQWGTAQLEVSDLSGKQIISMPVSQVTSDYTLDVSRWPRGLYLFRLLFRGTVVRDVKVMVE